MIPNYIIAGLWGAIGGIALIIGSLVGYKYNISNRIIAIITAFGSGILISAVCFELLFEAYFYGGIYPTTIGFVSGVVVFTIIDAIIHKFSIERFKTDHGSIINTESKHDNSTDNISEYNNSIYNSFKYNNSNNTTNNFNIIKHRYTKYFNKYQVQGLTTVAGALLDGIPEAIAIGLTFFIGGPISISLLIAVSIANSLEGVSASLNMRLGGWSGKEILGIWFLVVILTIASAMLSYIIFSNTDKHILAGALGIASGALLAMIADTMLPGAFNEMQEWTGLVMSMGFLLSFVLSHLASH